MLSMALVVAAVTLMVAKVDKGERVGEWKGPLIGVRWRVGVRRAARAAVHVGVRPHMDLDASLSCYPEAYSLEKGN